MAFIFYGFVGIRSQVKAYFTIKWYARLFEILNIKKKQIVAEILECSVGEFCFHFCRCRSRNFSKM